MTMAAPLAGDNAALTSCLKSILEDMILQHPQVVAVGVGTADLVEWPDGVVIAASDDKPEKFPLRAYIQEMSGLPTVVDGDANVAAYAEARCGVAAQQNNAVMLTVGTGIGGGLIIDGHIYHGTSGLAGEVGHMIVNPVGEPCACGNSGCLESLASGTALARNGQRAAELNPSSALAQLACGAENVTGEIVWQAARKGDPIAVSLFEQQGFWLGLGVASLIAIFDPQMVVIGGGLVRTGELLLTPVRRSIKNHLFAARHRVIPPLVAAQHGSSAGIVGAAILALDVCHDL
jgi:glucokinase